MRGVHRGGAGWAFQLLLKHFFNSKIAIDKPLKIGFGIEHGYFRSQGRGGNFSKKRRKYCSRCHVTMRVGAIESPMFVVFQKIFFRTVGLFKKILSSIEVMVYHIFRVWVPSQNF